MRTVPAALSALCFLAASVAFGKAPAQQPTRPRIDVAFVLDTTGSMGDEIEVVKEKLVSIARRLGAGQPRPDVRYAVIAFRDRGDDYVTKELAFDRDVKKVERFIRALEADGGGDEPEDVAAALHAASRLKWDTEAQVARVAFLVGDAGPQAYGNAPGWQRAVTNLRERKITVHTIGCSGIGGSADKVFRTIAERTRGDFEHLTYRRVATLDDGSKRTMLFAGGAAYEAEGELSEAEWKKGAEKLLASGRVKPSAAPAPRGPGVGLGRMAAGLGSGVGRGGAIGAPRVAPMEAGNNLDEEIASRLMEAAKEAGSKFE